MYLILYRLLNIVNTKYLLICLLFVCLTEYHMNVVILVKGCCKQRLLTFHLCLKIFPKAYLDQETKIYINCVNLYMYNLQYDYVEYIRNFV